MPCKEYKEKFNLFLTNHDTTLASGFFEHIETCSECYKDYKEHSRFEGVVQDFFYKQKEARKSACSFSADRFSLQLLGFLQAENAEKTSKNSAFINKSLVSLCRFVENWDISNKLGTRGWFLTFSASGIALLGILLLMIPRHKNFRNLQVKNYFTGTVPRRVFSRSSFKMLRNDVASTKSASIVYSSVQVRSYSSSSNLSNSHFVKFSNRSSHSNPSRVYAHYSITRNTAPVPVYRRTILPSLYKAKTYSLSSRASSIALAYKKCLLKNKYSSHFTGLSSYYDKKCISSLFRRYKYSGQREKAIQLSSVFPSLLR